MTAEQTVPDDVEWENLRAADLRALATRTPCVIVPVAAVEQHGPHLPVSTDKVIAKAVAVRAARKLAHTTPAIVTPVVWHGLSAHHLSFGGTLSLEYDSLAKVVSDLCGSLAIQGFQRICLLNAHGGNDLALRQIAAECERRLNVPVVSMTYIHLIADCLSTILEVDATVSHSGEAETSMMLELAPHLVRVDLIPGAMGETRSPLAKAVGPNVHRWTPIKQTSQVGVLGDARPASAEKGRAILDSAAQAVAEALGNDAVWR